VRAAALATLAWLAASAALAQQPAAGAADPSSVVGPPRGQALSGSALEARTEEVGGLLRCPVCQGLSVADSPADMAVSMKAQVKDLLARGYDQEQILAYFENSYGEFVRLEPPLRGVNWLVWVLPVLALAAGVGVLALVLRSRRAKGGAADPAQAAAGAPAADGIPGPDTLPDDENLARYVLRVRERAYGWPGGRRPERSA
jgi:cytochrome c-type biogenesis protein CcmH